MTHSTYFICTSRSLAPFDYGCTIQIPLLPANANDPAFQIDDCGKAMSYCSNFYFQAEFTQEMDDACA